LLYPVLTSPLALRFEPNAFHQLALDSNQQKFDKYSAYFLIKRKSTSTRSMTSVLVLIRVFKKILSTGKSRDG